MKEINYTEVHKKIINRIMLDGKKRKAEGIFDNSWFSIESKSESSAAVVLERALLNVSPTLEVRSVRIAGSTYQIPFPISLLKSLIPITRFDNSTN